MSVTDTAPREPIPLSLGLFSGVFVMGVAMVSYAFASDTTTRGWFATASLGAELCGVLLIASPELRPRVERAFRGVERRVGTFWRRVFARVRRLLRLPTVYDDHVTGVVGLSGAMSLEVQRGHDPPPANATMEEKVEYLLAQTARFIELFNYLENRSLGEFDAIRKQLSGVATDLRAHTAAAVQSVAEAELNMRLLGVAFVIVGLVFSYLANIA